MFEKVSLLKIVEEIVTVIYDEIEKKFSISLMMNLIHSENLALK